MTRAVGVTLLGLLAFAPVAQDDSAFLSWSARRAETIGQEMYRTGRVGGAFDFRGFEGCYTLLA